VSACTCEYCHKEINDGIKKRFCGYECSYHYANEKRKAKLCIDREARKRDVEAIVMSFGDHIALMPGTDKYYITDDGRVFSAHRWVWKEKSQHTNRGYKYVALDGAPKKVHQLVLLAFGHDRPDGAEVRHLNGKRGDNRLENLAWGTRKENVADMFLHGTVPSGERSGASKLSDKTVAKIVQRAIAGESMYVLAKEYGVSAASVCRWKSGKVRNSSRGGTAQNIATVL